MCLAATNNAFILLFMGTSKRGQSNRRVLPERTSKPPAAHQKPELTGPSLGKYLLEARTATRMSQKAAADEAKAAAKSRGLDVDPNERLVRAYESDAIERPDPAVLRALAAAYGRDYLELLTHVVFDRYQAVAEATYQNRVALTEARRLLWESSLRGSLELVAGVTDGELEVLQLKAKARVVEHHVVLDTGGMAIWESLRLKDTPRPLRQLWIVIPQPAAFTDDMIFDAVVKMVIQDVEITYFVQEQSDETPGGVDHLRKKVAQNLGWDIAKVEKLIKRVPLSVQDQAIMLTTDIVVAEPLGNPDGFATIRVHNKDEPNFCILLDKKETDNILFRLDRIFVNRGLNASREAD